MLKVKYQKSQTSKMKVTNSRCKEGEIPPPYTSNIK